MTPLDAATLPSGIRSRFIHNGNGLNMHILEAGFEAPGRPMVLLLHGFPELAFSWRHVMAPLAAAGFYVVAPDQRGYGRTTGQLVDYDGELAPYDMLNLTRDALALVRALGRETISAVVGHDFGASVAAYCALIRPDVFTRMVLMSAPFEGSPAFPFNTDTSDIPAAAQPDIDADLAGLSRPRKHYQQYYSTRAANDDMCNYSDGIASFLRGYFHAKSADWSGNTPFPLNAWSAQDLAKMPTYYVMDLDATMAETAATFMPSAAQISACSWMNEADLAFYAQEFGRTGFQGGLNWYRCRFDAQLVAGLCLYSDLTIDVPSCFIAGANDWGVHQRPGALDVMRTRACTNMSATHLVAHAGHWIQQEQPDAVVELLHAFLKLDTP